MDVDIGNLMQILIVDTIQILLVNWHNMVDIMEMMENVSTQHYQLKLDFKEYIVIASKQFALITLLHSPLLIRVINAQQLDK